MSESDSKFDLWWETDGKGILDDRAQAREAWDAAWDTALDAAASMCEREAEATKRVFHSPYRDKDDDAATEACYRTEEWIGMCIRQMMGPY